MNQNIRVILLTTLIPIVGMAAIFRAIPFMNRHLSLVMPQPGIQVSYVTTPGVRLITLPVISSDPTDNILIRFLQKPGQLVMRVVVRILNPEMIIIRTAVSASLITLFLKFLPAVDN